MEENIQLCSSAHNACDVALMALFRAGDKIAVDQYTYSHFKTLAIQLSLQLIPISRIKWECLQEN